MGTERKTTTAREALGAEEAERMGLGVERADEYSLGSMAEHLGIEPGELAQWRAVRNAPDAADAARRVEQLRQAKTELADADARRRALDAATEVEE